jgi:nucleoside-diphosphate-sugar epimerase
MRLLVTGASGFIGLALTKALIGRGHHVVALNRSAPDALAALAREGSVTIVRGDVSDREAVRSAASGVGGVFHVAAKAGVVGPYRDYYEANVRGTDHVIEAMKLHGVEKLVFTSSPSVVHGGSDVEGLDESAPYPEHHSAPYPETKAIAERAVMAANGSALSNGKRLLTVSLRPHLVWGPGDPNLAPRILQRARANRLVLVGGGHATIDATHLDSAVHAHLCAWDSLAPGAACAGRTYFIAQGEPMPVRAIIFGLLRAAGLPERARAVPLPVALATGSIVERLFAWSRPDTEPPLTRFIAEQLGTSHYFDLSAARRDLGYEAPISTEEGLRRLATFWQANGAP